MRQESGRVVVVGVFCAVFVIACDRDMPAEVRRKAAALIPDDGPRKATEAYLAQAIEELRSTKPDQMTLMLVILDDEISDCGCSPSAESLKALEEICAAKS